MTRILLLCLMLAMTPGCGSEKKMDEHTEHGETSDHHDEKSSVHLKEESQKMIGIEFVKAGKDKLYDSLELVGEIAKETENVSHVTSKQAGILKAHLCKIGDVVEQGTPVCEIDAKTGETIQIPSATHGIVLAHYLKPGDSVDSLTSIMTIANPDLLRASFNVYEKDLAGIKLGQTVSVQSIAYPDKTFEGEIVFISPAVDEKTRTIKIRVDVKNEEHLLKFGMFVTGELLMPISEDVLTVPHDAVQTIEGKTVVFILNQDEKTEFLMREIQTGRENRNKIEILSGLAEGEEVVGKGSFYLKSELLKGELEEGHAH